ncbi:MAG: hypothetical protein HKN45_06010, partial [Flavobacteriales bacterium]|nr:hypothetical protein [Flavobacteriales bacterium]
MKNLLIGTLTIITLVFISCERTEDDFQGPALSNIFGEFTILEELDITNRNVDFAADQTTVFTAVFSKQVDWEIHITGQTTGAHKVIEGFSAELNGTNARWNGTTTDIPLFKAEECAVELRIPSDSVVVFDTLNVTSSRIIEGLVVADFESGVNNDWNIFAQSGANMSFIITDDIPPAQGDAYYDMGGEVSWDYLIGLIEFPAFALGEPTYALSNDPTQVYFNVMLYIPEGIVNEIVLFQFREDDNGDGVYTEGSEDMFSIELTGLDAGWQLISVRYADMPTLVNGAPAAPFGNGLYEANKLNRVSVLFLANPV